MAERGKMARSASSTDQAALQGRITETILGMDGPTDASSTTRHPAT